jgi:peptide-methionine (S)-S-oxide reductase
VVEVTFDPSIISYDGLLDVFWACHDPTQLNRQGADVGNNYRSVIFFCSAGQEESARASLSRENASEKHYRPIVTEITPAGAFWRAEEYHQQYCARHGLASCRIS